MAVILLSGCFAWKAPDSDGPAASGSPEEAIVVASQPLAADAGARMLRAGGNAMDAALAMQWALAVVEPYMSGLGGDGSLLYLDAGTGKITAYSARATLPAAPPPADDNRPDRGHHVAVPGIPAMWDMAFEDHASLSLKATMEPAIEYAEDGFTVDNYLEWAAAVSAPRLASWPASAEIFFPGTVCPVGRSVPGWEEGAGCVLGEPLRAGDTFRQPDLAATLRRLSTEGLTSFYGGDMGAAIVSTVAARSGDMTIQDLAAYQAVRAEPLRMQYHELELVASPPPQGGQAVLEAMGILEGFDLNRTTMNSPEALHLLIEALRLTWADRRAWIGDPAFTDNPVAGLLHPAYLAERRALIDPSGVNPATAEPGDPWPYEGRAGPAPAAAVEGVGGHTTSYLVVDHDGNVAAVTTSVVDAFGVGMVVPGHGFLLNNLARYTGQSEDHAPGKRLRSSMAQTIALKGDVPVMVLGAAGSERIPSAVIQGILDLYHYGMDPQAAALSGRVHSEAYGANVGYVPGEHRCIVGGPGAGDVLWDRDVPEETLDRLVQLGHSPCQAGAVPVPPAFENSAGMPCLGCVGHANYASWTVTSGWMGGADDRVGAGAVLVVPPA